MLYAGWRSTKKTGVSKKGQPNPINSRLTSGLSQPPAAKISARQTAGRPADFTHASGLSADYCRRILARCNFRHDIPPKKISRWTPGLKKLKAISIRQPWAWLIVNGYKNVENRIWAANLRGPVLIHAGQSKSDTTTEALACIKRKYRVANLPDTFETGGIVGMAEITDCVQRHRSKWFHGPFGWTLAHARRLPFTPCKGQLKFFTPAI